MIDLVLDDLCGPTREGFDTGLELFVLPFDLYCLIALTGTGATKEGQAALFGVIRSGRLNDFRIEHRHICAIVIKDNDPLANANHICRYTDASFLISS